MRRSPDKRSLLFSGLLLVDLLCVSELPKRWEMFRTSVEVVGFRLRDDGIHGIRTQELKAALKDIHRGTVLPLNGIRCR